MLAPADVLCRNGGENSDAAARRGPEGTGLVAERLRKRVEACPMPGIGGITVSAGVACWQDFGAEPAQAFAEADAALYAAKQAAATGSCCKARPERRMARIDAQAQQSDENRVLLKLKIYSDIAFQIATACARLALLQQFSILRGTDIVLGAGFPYVAQCLRPQILGRYFLILATGVVLPVSVLTGIVVQQNWRAYASTAAASTAFTAVRCTLQTMELVSAERGPMNAALGENLPVPPALLASLRDARERSDAKLAELLALYRAPLSPHGAKFSNIQRIRQALAIARANRPRHRRAAAGLARTCGPWSTAWWMWCLNCAPAWSKASAS